MTASAKSDKSTAHQIPLRNRHRIVCTTRSSGSLTSLKLSGRRWGTGKCAQSPRDDQLCRPSLPLYRTGRAPSWASVSVLLPQRHSRSRGGACLQRLSLSSIEHICVYACEAHCEHWRALVHMRCIYFSFSLDAFWAQA